MFLSIVFVVGIWFAEVRFFKIKEIPFYDDLRFVSSHIKFKKSKGNKFSFIFCCVFHLS
jgi:hypothetical protein